MVLDWATRRKPAFDNDPSGGMPVLHACKGLPEGCYHNGRDPQRLYADLQSEGERL